jgi:biotin carboxyl carrier protein
MTSRELHWQISGKDLTVHIDQSKDSGTFRLGERTIPFRVLDTNTLDLDGRHVRFYVVHDANSYTVWIQGRTYHFKRTGKSALQEPVAISSTGEIRALMPGKLLRLEVKVGDQVSEKQIVAIMESMKMESALQAPKTGRIAEIRCRQGQVVEMGEVIMVIA